MTRAAGLFLINKNNQLLVCHPTNHAPTFFSIPKGKIEKKETAIMAAIRETEEESGIDLTLLYKSEKLEYDIYPRQKYKNKGKTLQPFVVYEDKNDIDFGSFELKCVSTFENKKGVTIPEMDQWIWVPLDTILDGEIELHKTQLDVLKLILDIKS